MMKPLPDGSGTNRDAIASIQRQSGTLLPEYKEPCRLPKEVEHLYRIFWEMSQGRTVSFGGVLGIPPSEMLAWAQLHRVTLQPWELKALLALDSCFLRVQAER